MCDEDLRTRVGVVTPFVPEVFAYPLTPRCSQPGGKLHLGQHSRVPLPHHSGHPDLIVAIVVRLTAKSQYLHVFS